MSGSVVQIITGDTGHTAAIGAALAKQCNAGECILLRGDLGAGKTSFARGFIRCLSSVEEEIVSPTFTLAQTYATRSGGAVWHFDLYRLKAEEEVLEIGMEEALQAGITLVEWPELLRHRLPEEALDVHIAYGESSGHRMITLSGNNAVWKTRLAFLGKSCPSLPI